MKRKPRKKPVPNGTGHQWILEHAGYKGQWCLLWPFSMSTPGYGQFNIGPEKKMAHRFMCELANGPAPSAAHVAAHSCGNRQCVNPAHLSWKTMAENQLDRHDQGQPFTGRTRSLKPAEVIEIRRLRGKETAIALAQRFGCTESNIRHVQAGATYRHIVDDVTGQLASGEKG